MTKASVDHQSAAVAAMAEHWPLISALAGGTSDMRKAGKTFLPQWPAEDPESYKERLATATLFPAFAHTASVLAAKPFARPMAIDGISSRVEGYFENIDLTGTDLHAFCGQVMLGCLQHGLWGVLAEAPSADGVRTIADERLAGIRPYLSQYPGPSILGWRSQVKGGEFKLTQLRLKENIVEPDGEWGDVTVEQVRVLTPGQWALYRKNAKDEWVLHKQGPTSPVAEIPFTFFYGLRQGFGIGKAPMLNLAFMNVEHWQSASDQQTILHAARCPILFAKGFEAKDKLVIGAKSAARSSNKDADLRWVEHTGAAIEAGRQSILDLEDRMRMAGAELLVQRPTITTATQVTSENEGPRSTLQKIVEEFEDSLESALRFMSLFLKEDSKPKVELFKDFGAANLSEKTGDLLLRAAEGEDPHVSSETVVHQLKRMDVLPPNLDHEEEQLRLTKQKRRRTRAANAQAKAAAQVAE